ncbi:MULTISPECIES: TRAP transporter large permease subunit [unclassified Imperialibacter]|uniref:TRAP transporter large permease n=1 Tax=unclassified Imperialibacter TaxID=2629706 RepID=UPI0012592A92|nr:MULTISPECIES: TRAP transporter large permease subunit [unclassified Imperialibacter]CAD5274202.1 Tripartite ATP-independent transporter DctM subunit [Imperialibacter sp. 75]CAD5287821.1 Tripartite ATP-independent transporter DctM subunit [Imperialibacter sp. 89]VVT35558.1 TRAP transporter, DctM subunit [Imperialibacter sp. EC-SDR9]
MNEIWALVLFGLIFIFILWGFPVAFTLGGLSVIFGLIFFDADFFYLVALRIYGTMNNFVLIAVPLFVFMGIMLEKSGLAESLLETMALIFGKFKGGLAVAVVLVGAMLAASTGIVGATVITMGLISLPTMLKRGFSPELATGTIASAGTLGQIIPPSVVLVLLGSVLNVSVGDLFTAAVVPGVALVFCYLAFIVGYAIVKPNKAPGMPEEEIRAFREKGITGQVIKAFVLPLLLIVAVLGSIFAGIASPTEAAGVGALGATLLTVMSGKFNLDVLKGVMRETTHLTTMVFTILIGATAFSLVFRALGGDRFLIQLIENSDLSVNAFLFVVMLAVFIAGFFIDFIEIIFIIVPVVAPIFAKLGVDLVWVGILLALNLQTSFLTPPFGFSLFYLKGVAPKHITTGQLYRGIVPFVLIQLVFLLLVVLFPEIVSFLPNLLKK